MYFCKIETEKRFFDYVYTIVAFKKLAFCVTILCYNELNNFTVNLHFEGVSGY